MGKHQFCNEYQTLRMGRVREWCGQGRGQRLGGSRVNSTDAVQAEHEGEGEGAEALLPSHAVPHVENTLSAARMGLCTHISRS